MKKSIFIFSLCIFGFSFGQKLNIDQVEKTSDLQMIAKFIKENPTHPKVPELKRKMVTLMGGNAENQVKNTGTKNTKTASSVKNYHKKTADLLTHMFSNDTHKKEAYLSINNTSQCEMELLISGKKSYKINVPAKKKNFILLDKGHYRLTTNICGAKYDASKNITKDIEITLGN